MAPKLEDKSRTGRDNQRYGADGERLVAGLVPLSADKKQVLLIQSTRRNGWVVPKGGWETDEKTAEDAACREAWEEAGIICKVQKDLGKIPDRRGADELTKHAPRAMFQFFEATVQKEEAKWPEMQKRDRKWMTYTEAKTALAARPELLEALNRSSIRKSEGLKLGQVCAKDLLKRIPPASGSKAALRDPVVELDVSSRCLTDDGLKELARGLLQTYHANDRDHVIIRLEELNLRDNQLTPASLEELALVFPHAYRDLRDLDLSSNNLCINSRRHEDAWEAFLRSLSQSCVLRRIDFSGNHLGAKAFEILLKVYSQESPIDFVLPSHLSPMGPSKSPLSKALVEQMGGVEASTREMSIGSRSDSPDLDEDARTGRTKSSKNGPRPAERNSHSVDSEQMPYYATTRGLRSVPYIIICNTSMDETSALYMSYILANHHLPDRLLARVPPAKAGSSAQHLASYDLDSSCRGMVYLPNSGLGNAASKVMSLAEDARSNLLAPTSVAAALRQQDGEGGTLQAKATTPGHRRNRSQMTEDEARESITADLDHARSRLQGNIIEASGHTSNDLWRVALRMLPLSRMMQPRTTKTPSSVLASEVLPVPPPVSPPLAPSLPSPVPKPKLQIIRILEIPDMTPKKPNPWGLPLTPKSTNQSIAQRRRKESLSTPATPRIDKLSQPKPEPPRKERAAIAQEYRSRLPLGFAEETWARILAYAVDGSSLMSRGQQLSVIRYAIDRRTLGKEREALGLKDAAQKWHILADMDCLTYEIR